ncbi:hypothetical protein G6011_01817 [Alternaria panax]|uniref:Uncharacterized protein n=1 Tax=Alternaria panax TaxID=48097 RepID=A0AAD4ILK1_9PLEO|nr:hypothetical protein G6011_01817 [Alternaria panax]
MVKDDETVSEDPTAARPSAYGVPKKFKELFNMSADDLQDWLGGEESEGAGWSPPPSIMLTCEFHGIRSLQDFSRSKDNGCGETIGHDAGRKDFCHLVEQPKEEC